MNTTSTTSSFTAVRPTFRSSRIDETLTGLLFAAWAVAALVAGADTLCSPTRTADVMASASAPATQAVTHVDSRNVRVASAR